jgi:hypothetical protein
LNNFLDVCADKERSDLLFLTGSGLVKFNIDDKTFASA